MKLTERQIKSLEKRNPEKSKKGLCSIHNCRSFKQKKDPLCSKHRHWQHKVSKPISYAYQVVKCNALRRKKEFTISMNYFEKLCIESGYIEGKGRRPESLSLDRIDNAKGYIEGNIRVISLSENSSKQDKDCPF